MVIENRLQRDYLSAVLKYLDTRLEREIYRWQSAGQNFDDRFRGLRINAEEALLLTKRAPGLNWGSMAVISQEGTLQFDKDLESAAQKIKDIEAQADQEGIPLRLRQLAQTFNLSEFEWWAFVVCLAPALDLRYERIFGYLQDDVTRVQPSVDLILNLLVPEGLGRLDYLPYFEPSQSLCLFRLLLPVEENNRPPNSLRKAYQAAPQVVSWLLGAYLPKSEKSGIEYLPFEEGDQHTIDDLIFGVDSLPSTEVIAEIKSLISLIGEDAIQMDFAARQISQRLEKPLLIIRQSNQSNDGAQQDQLSSAVRDARMLGAILYIQNADHFFTPDGCLMTEAFKVVRLLDEAVILGSKKPFRFADDMPGNDYPLMRIHFETLSTGERADLWTELLEGVADELPQKSIEMIAGQFSLTTGQIVAAASSAMSQALQEGRQLNSQDLFEAARFHSNHQLSTMADKILPRYSWTDLILPETPISMLHEMVGMIKSRPQVLEEWGLGKKLTSSMGVSALFTGPPGTGKTLAAQIIAHELGIDLYRIDLSTVISKYVGETEKNLERIFNEAQTSNAILFFDEADTIFGKRSEVKDAHDRYANIEVGYLLQRMEAYDGVAILATNLRANLDEAFTRRLQFIINFPFPEEEYRRQIWQVLLPPGMPMDDEVDLGLLAKRFKLAGGSIRNCIVTAAFLAADENGPDNSKTCVGMKHLMHGVKRELQKMGKLVQDRDFLYQE